MDKRAFKERLYAEFATLAKALANSHRLELIDLLAQAPRSVDDLATEAGMSVANTSAHLQVLRRARLVEADKQGVTVIYRLATPRVFDLWRTLRDLGTEQVAEIDRLVASFITDRSQFEAIDKEELDRRMRDGAVTVLDVRPAVEFDQGHIRGARSIPVDQLKRHLADLPRDQEIVAYCRGPYCVYADEAVRLLSEHGFHARRLIDGFPEWQAAGYPVESKG